MPTLNLTAPAERFSLLSRHFAPERNSGASLLLLIDHVYRVTGQESLDAVHCAIEDSAPAFDRRPRHMGCKDAVGRAEKRI